MKNLARGIAAALFALLLLGSAPAKDNTDREQMRSHHPEPPLVYDVEDTGAHYRTPVFASFDRQPIIRPLPDPFVFFDDGRGDDENRRDTSFASWERRR